MKKVFVITGEHSGDIHAGKVVEILNFSWIHIKIKVCHNINVKNVKKYSNRVIKHKVLGI